MPAYRSGDALEALRWVAHMPRTYPIEASHKDARLKVKVLNWARLLGLWALLITPAVDAFSPSDVKVMLLFKEAGRDGIHTVDTALTQYFQDHGYQVIDQDMVAQALRRDAALLKLYEIETAKLLGSRLGATIVVSGHSRTRSREKTYRRLGGKKLLVSQANVSAKAILVSTGRVIAAQNARARKPNDATGDIALEAAAEVLSRKLITGIDAFLNRATRDYRLVVLNVNQDQALALQQRLRQQVAGIRQIDEQSFVSDTVTLGLSVAKAQDMAFKRDLFTRLSGLGLGHFEIIAREGEVIYLRRSATQVAHLSKSDKTGDEPSSVKGRSPSQTRQSSARLVRNGTASSGPVSVFQTQDSSPEMETARYQRGYRKSWAVVIGINAYEKWPRLQYAVKDAQEVKKRLSRFGFNEVITLFDQEATQDNILRILGDELYAKTQAEDRVLIFFAGHGHTQDLPDGNKIGYIIPVDGDLTNYYATAISMRQMQDLSDRLRAKHIFYAMDSCFSGLLLRLRRGPAAAADFTQYTTDRARQVLTAGDEAEEVVEAGGHGLFTRLFLDGLDGAADLNQDAYITVSELSQFLTPRVLSASQNKQNPLFGRLGDGRGEFVFFRKP